MENIAAAISRSMYFFPGGFFISKTLRGLFGKNYNQTEWRTINFRGIKMKIDISKEMAETIYWRGSHDWGTIFAMENHVTEGDTVIDIGANQGEYTIWAARKAGNTGKVISFEPLSSIYSLLLENIKQNEGFNQYVLPIKKGLSDSPGHLPLYTDNEKHEGVPTLFPETANSRLLEEIELSTLDTEIETLKAQKIDFIKIDVEGAELVILKGGIKTIERFKPVIMLEFNKKTSTAAGYTPNSIIELLEQFGYKFYLIGSRGKLMLLNKKSYPDFCNIIAKVN